jgi:hypothetical protein
MIAKSSKLISVIVLFAALSAMLLLVKNLPADDQPVNKDPTVITFHMKKGQYLFVAFGNTASRDVQPLNRAHYVDDCELVFTFQPLVHEHGNVFWHHEEKKQSGGGRGWGALEFQDEVPVTMEDVSKAASLGGIQIYRISYGKIGEDTRSVIVAIADSPAPYPALFKVPKTEEYSKFEWKTWPDVR